MHANILLLIVALAPSAATLATGHRRRLSIFRPQPQPTEGITSSKTAFMVPCSGFFVSPLGAEMLKQITKNMRLTFLTTILLTCFTALHAAELRFAGTLGNSDDSQPVFAGKLAAGIGPVLDDEGTLWERGGSTRLNRYALDGRLLSSFEIPEGDERGNDGKLSPPNARVPAWSIPRRLNRACGSILSIGNSPQIRGIRSRDCLGSLS